jgi:prepilin-type N-terminal cleavage/methylation domain-containing protein
MKNLYFLHKKNSGFTLVELLVVIGVIGVLSSLVIVSLNSARGKANDSRRLADIKQLKAAINLYANDNNGNYPNSGAVCIGAATGTQCWTGYYYNAGGSGINASPSFDALLSPYIKVTPDPQPNRSLGDRYVYFSGSATINCNGVDSQTGNWIAWIPESGSPTR